MDRIDQRIRVARQPAGGQAFALTPAGKLPPGLLGSTLPYQAYTPTWAASGTAVSLGNGTITGRYVQIGKLIHAYGLLVMGSTTTFGTGSYTLTVPAAAATSVVATNIPAGDTYSLDSSASAFLRATPVFATATTFNVQYPATWPTGTQAVVGQLVPWTWATSDTLGWNLTYEAA